MRGIFIRACLQAVVVLAPIAALAESGQCQGWHNLLSSPDIGLAKVTIAPQVNFIKNASEADGCPNATAACLRNSFLAADDEVITSARQDDYVCAQYVNADGLVTTGWLAAAALSDVPAAPVISTTDWDGSWVGNSEQSIMISPGAAYKMIGIRGEATFGAQDAGRIKRGAVNVGTFFVRLRVKGDNVSFALGANGGSKPWAEGGPTECRIAMRRLGSFLLVEDNGRCGGHNVSFTGNYRRS